MGAGGLSIKRAGQSAAAAMLRGLESVVRRRAPTSSEAREVLVLEYMLPLGCCMHLSPLFEAISTRRPELRLTVATRGMGAALLRHNPHVHRVLVTADPLSDLPGAVRSLRSQLRAAAIEPDWVLTGASDQRSRIALLALAAGGLRAGFSLAPDLYQKPLVYEPALSLIDNNLRLTDLLGAGGDHIEPKVYFSSADAAKASDLLRRANAEMRPVLVLVTQTSGGQRTTWHSDRFVEVVRYAASELGMSIVYVGTAADEPAIEALRQQAGGLGISIAGQTSVTELAALLAASDAMVSLDTGTMHIGRAVELPMVVIGPSWQKPIEWMPLGNPRARILRGEDRETIPEGYQLDEVEAAEVTRALRDLLTRYPPSASAREGRVHRGICDTDPVRA